MTATQRTLAHLPLSTLRHRGHPANERDHDLGAIRQSLQDHGFTAPVVLDERTGLLHAGHGRIQALVQMWAASVQPPDGVWEDETGDWQVPVVLGWASTNETQATAARVLDNRTTDLGTWDTERLLSSLATLDDPTAAAFDHDDMDDLVHDMAGLRAWQDDTEALADNLDVEYGDLWQVGDLLLLVAPTGHLATTRHEARLVLANLAQATTAPPALLHRST